MEKSGGLTCARSHSARAAIAGALLVVCFVLTVPATGAASTSNTETAKIQALLGYVEKAQYIFLRDGKAETPAAAHAFFEQQLQAGSKNIQTAREFIDSIANSGETGQPYRVLLPGGWQLPFREWLLFRLPVIETELDHLSAASNRP